MPYSVDANHSSIVLALRQCGCTVQSLAMVGKGCPDLLVGRQGQNYLLEVKDGDKVTSKRKLTADEEEWHDSWRGAVSIVANIEEALAVVGLVV
jgi:hypothetical protein